MGALLQDLRYGLRVLIKRPGFIAGFLVMLTLPRAGFCQSARDQIDKEITKLSKTLEGTTYSDNDWKQLKPYVASSLANARKSLEAGRMFTALENLDSARTNLAGGKARWSNPAVVREGMKGFEAEWRRTDLDLKPLEQHYTQANWTSTPLALRAMAETDWARTRAYYHSSRAFAEATEPKDGLYYLGVSRGSIEFAIFCQSLQFKGDLPAPALRTMAPEIHRLEVKIIAVYQPPRSIEKHDLFIRIHSALKEAGDLEAAHLYAGALYKYLDSLQVFAALDTPVPGPGQADDLRNKISQARERLADGITDHSIAQIFLERAENGLDAGQPKTDYERGLQRAQIVVEQVIPAYFAALEKVGEMPVPPARSITVTLVRWPYT